MEISFNDVSYTYQPNTPFEHKAIEDLTFTIKSGSFVAIIGHTGSGKSTIIQHLNGLLRPTSGQVSIGDFVLSASNKPKNMKELRSKVGIVFQYPEHQLFEETVAKDIGFGPKNFGVEDHDIQERINRVIKAVHLPEELLERSPFDLSGGQMRRAAIAGVLAINPSVLVLDEPTAGLDPLGQKQIMDMFYQLHEQQNLTTVLVTHSMEDALKYADHVVILNKGRKYMEGAPTEVFIKKKALNQVQLDVPEIMQFLSTLREKFGIDIPYSGQNPKQLAKEITEKLKGFARNE